MTAQKLPESHPIEQKMGIAFYCTKPEGIGGKIRSSPKDFIVQEIIPDGRIIDIHDTKFSLGPDEPGLVTEFILIKRNFESHRALLTLAGKLGVNLNDVNIAGTKDKSAHTAQRATVWRVPPAKVKKVKINGLEIRSPRTTIYRTHLGDLAGNHFSIRIRGLTQEKEEIEQKIAQINSEIKGLGGIANFFGHQRFGSRRPISHEVGKALYLGEFEKAIRTYLGKIFEDESEGIKQARQVFQDTNDPKEAINYFPKNMVFERRLLDSLIKNPNNYQQALLTLPRNLIRLFFHSYQSYLWNIVLSERLRRYQNLEKLPGDIVENGEIVVPIVGYKTKIPKTEMGDFIKELLEKEGFKQSDFKAKDLPGFRFAGDNRRMIITLKDLEIDIEENNDNSRIYVVLKFSLKSGSYATVVLREYMKSSPISY